MDINSVKQAIEAGKVVESVLRNSGLHLHEVANQIKELTDLASLVVNAPVDVDKKNMIQGDNSKFRFGWNARGEADRLLWAKVMVGLPEIIGKFSVTMEILEGAEGDMYLGEVGANLLSDAIKKKLGVKG